MIEIPMEVSASAVEIPVELSIGVPSGSHVKYGSTSPNFSVAHHLRFGLDGFDFIPTHMVLYKKAITARLPSMEDGFIIDWSAGGENALVTYARGSSASGGWSFSGTATRAGAVTYIPPDDDTGLGLLDFYAGSSTTNFTGLTWYYVAWD